MSESGYDLQSLAGKLCSIVGEENVLVDEPMSEHTTFKVGGPADLYVIPDDPDEVKEILLAVKDAEAPYFILQALTTAASLTCSNPSASFSPMAPLLRWTLPSLT